MILKSRGICEKKDNTASIHLNVIFLSLNNTNKDMYPVII